MDKYKKGYKVVNKYTLTSTNISSIFCIVKYKINKWVKPNKGHGPLCVFDNLYDAHRFIANRESAFTMYSCLYKPSKENEVWNKYIKIKVSIIANSGVELASKVKLIRRISI